MSSKFDMSKTLNKSKANASEVTNEIIATAHEKKKPGRPHKDYEGIPFTLKIPTELHRVAKIVAGVKGIPLTALAIEAMQFYLDSNKKDVDKAKKIMEIMGA